MALDAPMVAAAATTLADYTRADLIVPQLRERDTAGVISELSQVLQHHGCVVDLLPFYHTALNRELLSNSASECGVALPHARLSGVKRLQFALGRSREPITWGACRPCQVHLVFLLAVPATDAAAYLLLLASLARLNQRGDLLQDLRAGQSARDIVAALERIKVGQA